MSKSVAEFKRQFDPAQTIKRLEKELKAARLQSADSVAVKDAIGTLKMALDDVALPEWTHTKAKGSSAPGVPTLFLSDFHWGERVFAKQVNGVNSFDLATARKRLKYTAETAVRLLKILSPTLDYPGICVPLGGDMISGNIHDELMATNELNTMPTVLDLFGHLVNLIGYMADTFGKVYLPCVSGNHGRDTKKIYSKDRNHTSFDWLLYQFLAKHFEGDKRITFFIPDGSDAAFKLYDYRYLLTHGDQFRGGDGMIGALGPILRGDHKKRSRNSQIGMEYDKLICGHWHQYIHHERVIVNGSLKGYDEYAYTSNFGFEPPRQALWCTHWDYDITFAMPVLCDKRSGKKPTDWASAI